MVSTVVSICILVKVWLLIIAVVYAIILSVAIIVGRLDLGSLVIAVPRVILDFKIASFLRLTKRRGFSSLATAPGRTVILDLRLDFSRKEAERNYDCHKYLLMSQITCAFALCHRHKLNQSIISNK